MFRIDTTSQLTSEISHEMYRAIYYTIAKDNRQSFNVLSRFIRRVITLSAKEKSLVTFERYLPFLPLYYEVYSLESTKRKTGFSELGEICRDYPARGLKEIIWFQLGYEKRFASTITERETINNFYRAGFKSFNRLLYLAIKNSDFSTFEFAKDEFDQISEGSYSANYSLKYKIEELKRDNSDGKNTKEIGDLTKSYEIEEQFETYKRHVILGLKYWIYYLFDRNIIGPKDATKFIDRLPTPYTDSEQLVKDVFTFYDQGFSSYMGWSEWDFKERPAGKVYSPPNPSHWMVLGFVADLLRNGELSFNVGEMKSEEMRNASFLYDQIFEKNQIIRSAFAKWMPLLKMDNVNILTARSEHLISAFRALKRIKVGETERAIAVTPLSQTRIDAFKEAVGSAWKKHTKMRQLFKTIGNYELITEKNTELKIVGQRSFFEKMKALFIDGELHQDVFGVDRIGQETAGWESNEFFSTILNTEHTKVLSTNLSLAIEESIQTLRGREIEPTSIFVSNSYNLREFRSNKKFISRFDNPTSDQDQPHYLLGRFDGFPIYLTHSPFLASKALVCDFKNAFKMRYRTDESWYEKELKIDIMQVTDEEARTKLSEDPDKWKNTEDGLEISEEDALVLIKTSIIADIWGTIDFQVIKPEAFAIGYLSPKTEQTKITEESKSEQLA